MKQKIIVAFFFLILTIAIFPEDPIDETLIPPELQGFKYSIKKDTYTNIYSGAFTVYVLTNQEYTEESVAAVEAKAAKLVQQNIIKAGSNTITDLLKQLGNPTQVIFSETAPQQYFLNVFYGQIDFFYGWRTVIQQIRIEQSKVEFAYNNVLSLHATFDEAIKYLGTPVAIKVNEKRQNEDQVLYITTDDGSKHEFSDIYYKAKGIRVFFSDKVIYAIYLFEPNTD